MMATLGTFLAAAAGPLAKRVLSALGIGVITYTGVDFALGALLDAAREAWGGAAANVAPYLAMSGANTALSILAGAIVARVAMIPLKRLGIL